MLRESFCSSPWFHIRMNYNGDFVPCRWQDKATGQTNFKDTAIMEFYNQEQMKTLRTELLNGKKPTACSECYYQDTHDKLSGRIKQLNKSGVMMDQFDLTMRASPHYEHFKYSHEHNGVSTHYPTDLQIDLGNTCNSACIMCNPFSSSKLQQEYKKLSKLSPLFIEPTDYVSWTRDPELLDRFVNELSNIPDIRYIHFLGGETLYDPAFYALCDKLIEVGVAKHIIVGTTTNGTIFDTRLERLISSFKEFHLGISIESVTPLNDYIRYPSEITQVLDNIDKFLKLYESSGLRLTLRITPNIFTISEIDQVFEYMIGKNIIAESCNILTNPVQLKIELLPEDIRQETIGKLTALIRKYDLEQTGIVNTRRPDLVQGVISNLIFEYRNFLETYTVPDNADLLRYQLVDFLKSFETLRQNSILDYAPRYKDFLRHYGY